MSKPRSDRRPAASAAASAKPGDAKPGDEKRAWAIAVGLAIAVLALYARVVTFEFVNYDDPEYVVENAMVRAGFTSEGLSWAFTTGHAANWHPVTWLSHMADVEMFGTKPAGHHFTSALLHAINAALVVWLFFLATGSLARSAVAAALFAVHPLRVESVAWVSERKDVLSACFGLLTLLCYVRYARARDTGSGHPSRAFAASLLFFALGLMSKPMVVTLPFVMLLLDAWPLARLRSIAGSAAWPRVREKLPYFALAAASSVATVIAQHKGAAVQTLEQFSFGERIANALVSYARYLEKTVWPFDLTSRYSHPGSWPALVVIGSAVLVLVLTVLAWRGRARAPFVLVGWLWFLGVLVPVIGIVQVGGQSMADRYTYLPHVGLFVALVWGIRAWTARVDARWIGACAIGAIGACAWRTLDQLACWKDSGALFEHALGVDDRERLSHNQYGVYLQERGRVAEAEKHFRAAIALDPAYGDALHNLGWNFEAQKRFPEALEQYHRALESDAKRIGTRVSYGALLSEQGRVDEGIAELERAVREAPANGAAHKWLGAALQRKGRHAEALEHYKVATRFLPEDVDAHYNVGALSARAGDHRSAIAAFERVLAINPGIAAAHLHLAAALGQTGAYDKALAHSAEAVRLRPGDSAAAQNHASLLVRVGRRDEAIACLRSALRARPGDAAITARLRELESGTGK